MSKERLIHWAFVGGLVLVGVWVLKAYIAAQVLKDVPKHVEHKHSKGSTWAPSLVDGPNAELAAEWPGAVASL